ncbi:MAG: radical SAM protein [Elusimicrobia bacterium]|nr:radical SAM protein [Elusimicrobiota bacterium]
MAERRGLKTSEVQQRYAVGLARTDALPPEADPEARLARRHRLVAALTARGVRGWADCGTFYTRRLPAGCIPCLKGQGSNLCLTTLCNRDCFFCFNPEPRAEGMSVHGRAVSSEAQIPAILEEFDVKSLGLSGGEPLLDPDRVVRVIGRLRRRFGPGLRIDLYTNGDLLTPRVLDRLVSAGLDGLRMNLAVNGYDIAPVKLGLSGLAGVSVELPVIPWHRARLRRLVRELDTLGAPQLILHELFVSAHNIDSLRRLGCRLAADGKTDKLAWSPVAGSDEEALELLLYAMDQARLLSVYYCSTGTQQWIAEQALARRRSP